MGTDFEGEDVLNLLRRHADLEDQHSDGDSGSFPSGWQCENPWRNVLEQSVAKFRGEADPGRYVYADDNDPLRQAYLSFHTKADTTTPSDIFLSDGASSILLAFVGWLRNNAHGEVYYIPPLYFSLHYVLRLLGVRTRAVSGRHAFEQDFSVNLPNQKCVLILSDPIWYAGLSVPADLMDQLKRWQRATGSLIFVDGSFQYMKWDRGAPELSAQLDPNLTIRLLCPTKALAMHGHRFAYATMPSAMRREFARISTTLIGSSSIDSAAFGAAAVEALNEGEIVASVTDLISQRHQRLREQGRIMAHWQPDCGYFCFEQVLSNWQGTTPLMDGSYFEQRRFPDHRRINLLSPSIELLNANGH